MRTLVVALGVVGLLAGCGDKDEAKPAVSSALSKAEYEARFKETVAEVDAGPKIEGSGAATPEQQGEALAKGIDRLRQLASALSLLQPPAEIRHAHEQFVAGLREIADQAQKAATALKAGNEAAARRLLNTFATPATVAKIAAAKKEFASKGYDLGDLNTAP
jgi:TolA-binding protein